MIIKNEIKIYNKNVDENHKKMINMRKNNIRPETII